MNLTVNNLSFGFAGGEISVFSQMTLVVSGFRRLALLGPSGCGKSTLLKLIGGAIFPDSGSVSVNCDSLNMRAMFSYVSQEASLLPWLTVEASVSLGSRLAHGGKERASSTAARQSLVGRLGLSGHEQKRVSQLSGGMKQRTALVSALTSNADLLLLDEPFAGSDSVRRQTMHDALKEFSAGEGSASSIFTTHDAGDVVALADAVVWLTGIPGDPPEIIDAKRGWGDTEKSRLAKLMVGGILQ